MTYKDTRPDLPDDTSTGDRYLIHQMQERERGREPKPYGEWMAAGQSVIVCPECDGVHFGECGTEVVN